MGQHGAGDGAEHDDARAAEVGHHIARGLLSEGPLVGVREALAAVLLREGDAGIPAVVEPTLHLAAGGDLGRGLGLGRAAPHPIRPALQVRLEPGPRSLAEAVKIDAGRCGHGVSTPFRPAS